MLFDRSRPELRALPRPVRRGAYAADYQVVIDDAALGDVRKSNAGYAAFDHTRGVWVGPFKKLDHLVKFFRSRPGEFRRRHPRWKGRPNVVVLTRWGRAWWWSNLKRWTGLKP
jgi:hypothetical protein